MVSRKIWREHYYCLWDIMKLSVVISIKNRSKHFKHTLRMFKKQIMSPDDFELVIVDDNSSDNIRQLLISQASNMNIQYIKIDSNLNDFPIYWGPSISNNIGFKASRGEVIMITGPEILHQENNFNFGYESAMKDVIAFGHVYHSNPHFTQLINNEPNIENFSFNNFFEMPSSKAQDMTLNTYYWFICTVKKQHIMNINGCDEEYMRGICGDDDDFVNRIEASGVARIHDFRMIGIHQDHSAEDASNSQRIRHNGVWERARKINTDYLNKWYTERKKSHLANVNRNWGSDNVILSKEIFNHQ